MYNNGAMTWLAKKTIIYRQRPYKEVYTELRRRMDEPVPGQGVYLRSVVLGHIQYYVWRAYERTV